MAAWNTTFLHIKQNIKEKKQGIYAVHMHAHGQDKGKEFAE